MDLYELRVWGERGAKKKIAELTTEKEMLLKKDRRVFSPVDYDRWRIIEHKIEKLQKWLDTPYVEST